MVSLFPETLPCRYNLLLRHPARSSSFRSPVPNRDVTHPPTRLSAPSVVQPFVAESRDGQREFLLCVDVGVWGCEWSGVDGLRVGGVEYRAWGNEGRV